MVPLYLLSATFKLAYRYSGVPDGPPDNVAWIWSDWLTDKLICWLTDKLKKWLFVRLAKGLTDSPTSWLIYWLTDWLTDRLNDCLVDLQCARKQSFPTCSPPWCISAEERCPSSLHSVYSAELSRGSAAPLHLHTRPKTPLLRPPLISNRDLLSPSLASPFSRSSTPTDMLDEAILKELTDVGWFAPGFLTLPGWCIWCGVYSALINV